MPTTSQHTPTAEPPTRTYRLAKLTTEVLAPVPVVAVLCPVVGWHTTPGHLTGLGYGLLLAVFASLIPGAIIIHSVRSGRVTDHHIRHRTQRRNPLLLACLFTAIGTALLAATGAPHHLVLTGAAILAAELPATLVNVVWWKMSVHTAIAASSAVVLIATFGPWLTLATIAVIANAWSRVHLNAHTPAQVITGALTGTVTSGILLAVLSQ